MGHNARTLVSDIVRRTIFVHTAGHCFGLDNCIDHNLDGCPVSLARFLALFETPVDMIGFPSLAGNLDGMIDLWGNICLDSF